MNNRTAPLLALLLAHLRKPLGDHEKNMAKTIHDFVLAAPDCAERTNTFAHLTGSAWIIDRTHTQTLLCHHRNLGKWLQLGGHADGNLDLLAVALREAEEESGLKNFRILSREIYDVDAHRIPERAGQPGHWHYDIRFLLEADADAPLIVSEESYALAWVPLNKITEYSREESLLRMRDKTPPLQNC